MNESTLILPGQEPRDTLAVDALPEIVWVRNPRTGVIYKLHRDRHRDTVTRVLSEQPPYTVTTEAAAKAQAVELARLQGRPLPPWAEAAAEAAQPEVAVERAEKAENRPAPAKTGK